MNALKSIESVREIIKQEEEWLEKSLQHRALSIGGVCYINDRNGRFDENEMRLSLNSELRKFVHKILGLGLISNFKSKIGVINRNTELDGLHSLLDTHSSHDLNGNDYLDGLIKLLAIDENYFYKLIAHNLVYEKLEKNKWYVSSNLSEEEINEVIEKVKFNIFSISCISDIDSFNEIFMLDTNAVCGFVQTLATICDVYTGSYNNKSEFSEFGKLNAFSKTNNSMEYKGIKLTAQKNGKIKVSLEKALAQSLEEKVKPFLKDFKMFFV